MKKSGAPSTIPLLAAVRGPTGYNAFTASNTDEVNDGVNEEREASKTSHKQHAGMFQIAMGAAWKKLTPEEKGEWNRLAADNKAVDDPFKWVLPPAAAFHLLFITLNSRNQKIFVPTIDRAMRGSQGFRANQCGDSAFFTVATFRNETGELQSTV